MNMIDIYLKMNMCVRDKDNNIYIVESNDNKKLIGKIKDYKIKDGVLDIVISPKEPIQFLQIKVSLDKDE